MFKRLLSAFSQSNYYSHINKPKSRLNIIPIGAAVIGIEFCYAAENAFASPILLNFGLSHIHLTLVWCLSPILGFLITPTLGVLSDNCTLKIGRRRPFIFIFSIGIVLGLILVPNGRDFGIALGDTAITDNKQMGTVDWNRTENELHNLTIINASEQRYNGRWGLFLTVMGTALLDFDADACQSPARAYLLDVTLPEDHAKGLSTFTVMAGMGGALGYTLGAIHWNATITKSMLENHVKTVYNIILVIFIVCLLVTLCSYSEKPITDGNICPVTNVGNYSTFKNETIEDVCQPTKETTSETNRSISAPIELGVSETSITTTDRTAATEKDVLATRSRQIRRYFYSIIFMPPSLRIVCLTNLFCWMSLACYTLYFTDFVGEAIFNGNPRAPAGSSSHSNYDNGVQFACWGLAVYSLGCSIYSCFINKLITNFGAKFVYIGGSLTYCFGMTVLAIFRYPTVAVIFSCTVGVMYSTLFNMPYLLVSHYHANNLISIEQSSDYAERGLGTDIAIVGSMAFPAQFISSACIGPLVNLFGSTVIIVCAAAFFSLCAAISATQILYYNL